MFNQLSQIYPQAIICSKLNPDPNYFWLKDPKEETYMGIPIIDLTEEEMKLLSTLFPLDGQHDLPASPSIIDEWRKFLLLNGPLPSSNASYVRLIYYSIPKFLGDFQFAEWQEVVRSLFSEEVLLIPFHKHRGVILEESMEMSITEVDLYSAIEAFESDFFIKIHFYIGEYHPLNENLKLLFQLEQELLDLAIATFPEERIFTMEKIFAVYLYKNIPSNQRNTLFSNITKVFEGDPELSKTIQTYIENQSNATLTAKQLFMHRNSLQYRIDKFIEKTKIDIKTFHGAFYAYLACLHFQATKNNEDPS